MEPMRPDQVAVPQDRVDNVTGLVRVWSLHTKAYKNVAPVDACEMIARGSCTLDEPVPVAKPAPVAVPEPEPEQTPVSKKYTTRKSATRVTDSE